MITAIVLTKNAEKEIKRCLHALEWCDEVIVIDDYSDDNTVKEIQQLNKKNIKVISHHLHGNFAAQRNFGLEKAQGEWVLFIDADELVSPSLQYEIVATINASIDNICGYYIRRIDTLWGKELKHGEVANIKLLRLAKKNAGKWNGTVHEIWKVSGRTEELKNHIHHYPHQNLSEFLSEINFYTDLRASELFKDRTKVSWWTILVYPTAKFIQNYVFKLGFLDDVSGLLVAIIMSLHSFLVRGKLWWLWQKNNR